MINPRFQLLQFQKEGVKFIYDHRSVLIGDEMGLGKSLQAIAFADKYSAKALVVCPAYLINNWEQEIEKFLVKTKAKFEIISYDKLKKMPVGFFSNFNYIIADEVQNLKNPKAQRTQVFNLQFDKNPPKAFVGLSGTPILNRVSEFYSTLLLVSKHPTKRNGHKIQKFFKDEEAFCDHFCYVRKIPVQGFYIKKYDGSRNENKLKALLRNKYIRREADKILDLPPIIEKEISIPMSEVEKLDPKMRIDFEYGASHISTTKAVSALAKARFTAKYAIEVVDEAGQAVIFSDHVKSSKEIYMGLLKKISAHIITGETPTNRRQQFVNDFQTGKVKGLVCTIGAAGIGFTMTRARDIIFNDISWVPGMNSQAIKRIHRIGQKNKCCAHFILGSPFDKQIVKTVRDKERTLKKVL